MSISRVGHGTTQACAACKYQRRKCASDCILAPYFPHDRQRQFLNAHKLFGVSNITKIIKNLNPSDKDEAMRTIIIQSDVRANDPVGGCYRIIRDLQRQIELYKAELELVLHQLALCRAQAQQIQMIDQTADDDPLNAMYDPMAMIQFSYPQNEQEEQEFNAVHQDYQQLQDNVNALTIKELNNSSGTVSSGSDPTSFLQLLEKENSNCFVDECDEIKPLIDVNDVKFEADELVERQFVPSTQLLISS